MEIFFVEDQTFIFCLSLYCCLLLIQSNVLSLKASQHMGVLQASSMGWNGAPVLAATPIVKKVMRLDVPVDKYPNVGSFRKCFSFSFLYCAMSYCHILNALLFAFDQYNFVGRLLGPRGNSLKRVEASTQCRVYIRGRGSVKDSVKVAK